MKQRPFPDHLLRPGSPTEPAFKINEIPHLAKLDQNESPLDIPNAVKRKIVNELLDEDWNRYPQPKQYEAVKERFSATVGIPADRLILTVGADQVIFLAFWAAGGQGRRARIFEPTYPMYSAFAKFTQTEIDRVILGPDFNLPQHGLGDPVDLLALVSPNNPTGGLLEKSLVEEALHRPCLVLLDEAYADYVGESLVEMTEEYPNLLVARSLSKAQLAGVRLGYGVGHPHLINVMERLIFAPYHLNTLQMIVAANYDLIKPQVSKMVNQVVFERERMSTRLVEMGVRVYPSRANFILFEVESAAMVNRVLLDSGVRLRDVSSMAGMGEHLRVTVGTEKENDLFLEALEKALEAKKS